MKKVVVLGAGMVGRVIALDLAAEYRVESVDVSRANLARLEGTAVKPVQADLASAAAVRSVIEDADLVVGAVPGSLGFATLRETIAAGKNAVDISFFPEDALALDDAARGAGVTAVVDCGVAPGMDNMILGHEAARMTVRRFACYVGGLPFRREFPFEYKAPFSPADVIEEYTRPARYVENGHLVVKPALSDVEHMDFPEIGTLEAFNSDGLRSLLTTMKVPNMIEKTLRYPGHVEHIRVLRDSGFFAVREIDVRGAKVRPLDVTSAVLFKHWHLHEKDDEFTVMRIVVEGLAGDSPRRVQYDLFDRRDRRTGFSSMARTTGFPAAAVARLVLAGRVPQKGVLPPELLGADESVFRAVMADLAARNVVYRTTEG
ncbi:MAG TPA: saccharopine dehydrogenase C-terminal domain-containing protein [Candidatus Aminicenantes bacterium]|nr:saccharopine dehydrogenase C-terminal domain-containing protein [Candidatus Aminicenantes bacterium]HRY65255.1 saccharopine dehydrogenase C-terminal domain-containing protein [Candidatus Aminicenantes bacterium]HRZ72277.1 saccharopine dehydrogenase C-terminal domain-containing protein [Candidatus Aminicenantes bacterium]